VRQLRKTYPGGVEAVRGIDFQVEAGEVFGLLGPNGAGKSTTIGMLTTTIVPTSGSARVAGFDVASEPLAARGVSSVVFQDPVVDRALTGRRNFEIHARLWGVARDDVNGRIEDLAESFDLTDLLDRPVASYSGGQRRRLEIARALVSEPRVLFLDEPTTGLDPQSRANLWKHIRSLRDDLGVTVVLTTHYLDEADALADRLLVMDHGVVVADDTSENLKARLSGDVVTVTVDEAQRAAAVVEQAVSVRKVQVEGDRVHVTVERGDVAVAPLLRALDAAGLDLQSISVARPTLDDVFLTLTGHALREDEEVV